MKSRLVHPRIRGFASAIVPSLPVDFWQPRVVPEVCEEEVLELLAVHCAASKYVDVCPHEVLEHVGTTHQLQAMR